MEHPIFFIDAILSAMGFHDFALHYSHVTYTWLTMLILILSALFLAKKVTIVPEGGQNFFEVLISGLENFMVEITGPEGRFFFPFIATVFLFVLVSNMIGLIPGMFSPTANLNTTLAWHYVPLFIPISSVSNSTASSISSISVARSGGSSP